jgi:hypothetical protein
VGPDGVVDGLPGPELDLEGLELGLGRGHLVELLGVGPVRPLDGTVELRAARRQDEEADAAGLAGGLELNPKLGAVVDADRPDPERHPLGETVEDRGRVLRRRKQAARTLALGLATLTIPAVPLLLLGPVPAVAVLPAALAVLLFLGLGRPSVKDWLSEP